MLFVAFLVVSCASSVKPAELARAESEYMRGNYKEAVSILAGKRLGPEASLVLAKSYFFLGRNGDAEKVLQRVVKKYPYHFEANLWLSRLKISDKNYEEAEKYLLRALSSNPVSLQANLLYSRLLLRKGLVDEAIYRLEMARTNEITLSHIYRELEKLYAVIGDNETRGEIARGAELLDKLVSDEMELEEGGE